MMEYGLYKDTLRLGRENYYIVLHENVGIYCFDDGCDTSFFGNKIYKFGYEKIEEYTC